MRDPDLSGVARAWKSKATGTRPDHDASIVQWLINGPFHPAWKWWVVGAVSLRDIPGVPPANKKYPEAEFEIMIVAIAPDSYGEDGPDPDVTDELNYLQPIDLIYHFHGVEESEVEEIVELAVKAIVVGQMSPDEDYRRVWEQKLDTTLKGYKARRN